jgi:hypothetical protein
MGVYFLYMREKYLYVNIVSRETVGQKLQMTG